MKTSISRRIIVAVLISQFLLVAGLTVTILLYSRAQLFAAFVIMLRGRADTVLSAIHESEDGSGKLTIDRPNLYLPGSDRVEVRNPSGDLVWRSNNWSGPPAGTISGGNLEFSDDRSGYRGIVVHKATIPDEDTNPAAPPKQVVIIYASSTRELQHRIFNIGCFALGSGFLLLVCTGFLASRGVKTGLAPMEVLAAEASHVSPSNWQIKLPKSIRTTKELAPLVVTLDATLAGLQRAFSRERDFVADAAHELKTAVAILKSSLQIFSYQLSTKQQYKAGVDRCLTDCDRLEALVFSMLSLARAEQRAEQGQSEDFPAVDLFSSCERAVADLHSIAESRNIQIHLTADVEPAVKADPDDLHTVWVNLLHNALQHSPIGSAISVSIKIGAAAATAQVVVEDFGSGIPPKHLPHVFDRFYRGDPSRSRDTGGFGLGLSISKAIIELYRGQIYLESDASGTSACVSLPVHDLAASNRTAARPAVLNPTDTI